MHACNHICCGVSSMNDMKVNNHYKVQKFHCCPLQDTKVSIKYKSNVIMCAAHCSRAFGTSVHALIM